MCAMCIIERLFACYDQVRTLRKDQEEHQAYKPKPGKGKHNDLQVWLVMRVSVGQNRERKGTGGV